MGLQNWRWLNKFLSEIRRIVPYLRTGELPENVQKVLPYHAQEIYMASFNSAWKQYDRPEERRGGADREEVAHKVAWAAVKKSYIKSKSGKWKKISKSKERRGDE